MTNSRTPGILVTGPTGNIGRELTKELSAQNVLFRAMVRSRKGADALVTLKGVEIVVGDFNDAKSIADALEGVDRVFLLTNSLEQAEEQQCAFVDVAKSVGVSCLSGRLTLILQSDSFDTMRWSNRRFGTQG